MKLERAAWIAMFLSIPLLILAFFLSSRLENALAFTTMGYCVSVRIDPLSGRVVEVSYWLKLAFCAVLLPAIVPPPFLWTSALFRRWILKRPSPRVHVS